MKCKKCGKESCADATHRETTPALEALPEPDLKTADGVKEAVAALHARHNELIAREKHGRTVTAEEWETMEGGWREFSTRLKAIEDATRSNTGMFGGDEAVSIAKANARLQTPDGMPRAHRSYFNVIALSFEEIAGLSHLKASDLAVAGLRPEIARVFLSPSAAKLRESQARLQFLNDVLLVKDVLLNPGSNMGERADLNARHARMRGYGEWAEYEKLASQFEKAFNEGTSTAGLNWVPTVLSAQVMDLVQAELRIAALFPQITMTSRTLDWPVLGGDLVAYLMAEAVADGSDTPIAASTATTNKITFTAQKIGVRTFASSEIIEDAINNMIAFILGNAAKVLARGIEDALINGDTGTTLDGATFNPAGGVRRAWKGLRWYALKTASYPAAIDMGGAAPTVAKLLDVQLNMGVWGTNPRALSWVTGFRGLKRLMGMTEMVTMDKLGNNATILTGQVGSLFGSPVILSEFVFDQKATGAYGDGLTRNFGSILLVHRDSFGLANRRAISINASRDRYIEVDQTVFVGTTRADFEPFYTPSAAVTPVGILYDIS